MLLWENWWVWSSVCLDCGLTCSTDSLLSFGVPSDCPVYYWWPVCVGGSQRCNPSQDKPAVHQHVGRKCWPLQSCWLKCSLCYLPVSCDCLWDNHDGLCLNGFSPKCLNFHWPIWSSPLFLSRWKVVMSSMKTGWSPPMKLGLDPVAQSHETHIMSKWPKTPGPGNTWGFYWPVLSFCRLYFQCKYSGVGLAALSIEPAANVDPLPLVASGPLQVELRLGKGQCVTKGCVEGEQPVWTSGMQSEFQLFQQELTSPLSPQNKWPITPTTVLLTTLWLRFWGNRCTLRCALWAELIQILSWFWGAAGRLLLLTPTAFPSGTFWWMGKLKSSVFGVPWPYWTGSNDLVYSKGVHTRMTATWPGWSQWTERPDLRTLPITDALSWRCLHLWIRPPWLHCRRR